jgi:hypothetical protein
MMTQMWPDDLNNIDILGKKVTQVALYCESLELMETTIREVDLEWTRDTAIHYGMLFDTGHACGWRPIALKTYLAFNYELIDGEFELMAWEYMLHSDVKHPFHDVKGIEFACVSYRCESVHQEEQTMLDEHGIRPLYRFVTQDHTNPKIVGKSRYMDSMFDYETELGYLRCVSKIPWEPYYVVPLGSGVELNPYHFPGHHIPDAHQDENGRWIRNNWR